MIIPQGIIQVINIENVDNVNKKYVFS